MSKKDGSVRLNLTLPKQLVRQLDSLTEGEGAIHGSTRSEAAKYLIIKGLEQLLMAGVIKKSNLDNDD